MVHHVELKVLVLMVQIQYLVQSPQQVVVKVREEILHKQSDQVVLVVEVEVMLIILQVVQVTHLLEVHLKVITEAARHPEVLLMVVLVVVALVPLEQIFLDQVKQVLLVELV